MSLDSISRMVENRTSVLFFKLLLTSSKSIGCWQCIMLYKIPWRDIDSYYQDSEKKIAEGRKEAMDGRLFLLGIMCQEMCLLSPFFVSSCYLVCRRTYCILGVSASRRETRALCKNQSMCCFLLYTWDLWKRRAVSCSNGKHAEYPVWGGCNQMPKEQSSYGCWLGSAPKSVQMSRASFKTNKPTNQRTLSLQVDRKSCPWVCICNRKKWNFILMIS